MDQKEVEFFQNNGIVCQNLIAKGAYGTVYLVYSTQYGSNFALKRIPEKLFSASEIDCLIALDDQKIVSLYKYFKFDGYVYLLMEHCQNDLEKLLRYSKMLSNKELQKYVYDVILCVKACHDRKIAHCDIKPSNFLIDKYGRVKITDFGLSKIYSENPTSSEFKGTKLFMAPEIFKKASYNPMAADIWSLGVTLFYIATNTYPFFSNDQNKLIEKIESGEFPSEIIDSRHLRDLITKCITVDPNERPTVSQLLELPYFNNLRNIGGEKLPLIRKDPIMESNLVTPQTALGYRRLSQPRIMPKYIPARLNDMPKP
ncbi:CAMK family protein kinase [Trichomonas vaginalis G3]|uniref:CAMK family protein kinase n=1 Tax=Trichomonas vaginalis (strain ATCC PRA-98 / G3) TaxID=412133 RepID=A2E8H4_TRIV3|nr:MAP kinase kinase kinase protein [Trichomonas vaginalis G3]EAY11011.1 CAMK family protein kinase [Trichomonas vaginalis G3]KAI5531815.1 MAP kinase kinase kinase protein [Trichomonas vaginalis G3]|eukprot:XP_001323234.1 CAMK family protein kinase [Trichomonas vaginalis G3]